MKQWQTILMVGMGGWAVAWAGEGGSYYRAPLSYSTVRDPDPPKYVRRAGEERWWGGRGVEWLDLGMDHRVRYEYRDDDLRRGRAGLDEPFLYRTRVYAGVHGLVDPFRLAVEVQDARRYGSEYPRDVRDVNEFEVIRLYGELWFGEALGRDALGNGRPLSLRWGIHNFEFLDRRLLGNNQWRNTANTFVGFHGSLGQEKNDWQLDLLAVQPLLRRKYEWDEPVDGQWLFGAIGHWRLWSEMATVEPYWLVLDQDGTGLVPQRQVQSPGMRVYGKLGGSGFDYDASATWQFGRSQEGAVRALGATGELGYRFGGAMQPRLSVFYGYASGDREPGDGEDNRFERFYGFGRPWSANDYILYENISAPKVRVELTPHRKLRADFGYSWYWLASAQDRFLTSLARDRSGQSGSFLGHEFDIRARWQLHPQAELTAGYAHFADGEYTRKAIRPGDTDFFYLELSLRAF